MEHTPLSALLASPQADHKAVIKLAFRTFDSNGDGKLSEPELRAFFARSGHTDIDVGSAFRQADTDGDNKLSFDEFYAWVEAHPEVVQSFTDVFASWASAAAAMAEAGYPARKEAKKRN